MKEVALKRKLGLFHVTIAGVGIILGAGIYALIGVAAGETGNTIWLSFLIASVVAAFTALSYAELSSIFKGDAGEYDYCEFAFGRKLAWLVSLIIIFTGIISAATVALGFAGYFVSILPLPFLLSVIALIALMTFLNFYGIEQSNKFNIIATTIEFIGLIIIILLGISEIGNANLLEMPNGFSGVLKSGALVFFAFMGFETIIKLREETKNPSRTIPLAIILSVIITTAVYVMVSIAAVNILPAEQLAASTSPLASVAEVSFGKTAFIILAIIALFSTSNTVLLTMLTTSRMLYGMGKNRSLPSIFSRVHEKRRTPHVAVLLTGITTLILALIGDIEMVANITTALLFLTFAVINFSVIIIRYKTNVLRPFRMPFNLGKFPVPAVLGLITSLIMLTVSLNSVFS